MLVHFMLHPAADMYGDEIHLTQPDLAGTAIVANNRQAGIRAAEGLYKQTIAEQNTGLSCRLLDRIACPGQERTLAPTAMIRFSYVIDSPSAVLSCFLLTSTSDTWTPVRNSMSASTTVYNDYLHVLPNPVGLNILR